MVYTLYKHFCFYSLITLFSLIGMVAIHSSDEPRDFSKLISKNQNNIPELLNSIEVHEVDSRRKTLLEVAAYENNIPIVRAILAKIKQSIPMRDLLVNHALNAVISKPVIWESKEEKEETKYEQKLREQKMPMIKLLVEEGNALITIPYFGEVSPFVLACRKGFPELVRYFMSFKLSNNQLKEGLSNAVEYSNVKIVKVLLDSNINCSQLQASQLFNFHFLKHPSFRGIDLLNIKKVSEHFTSKNRFFQASLDQFLEDFFYFINPYNDLNSENIGTIIHLLESLVLHDKIDMTSPRTEAIFQQICRLPIDKSYKKLLTAFLKRKEFAENSILSGVVIASFCGYTDTIKLLMKHVTSKKKSVLLNNYFFDRMTALMGACLGQQFQVIKLLVEEYHVDVNVGDSKSGMSPLMIVAGRETRKDPRGGEDFKEEEDLKIVKYLRKYGAIINKTNQKGKTAYTLAQETQAKIGNNQSIVNYFANLSKNKQNVHKIKEKTQKQISETRIQNNADPLIEKNLNEKTRKSNNSDSLPDNRDQANEIRNQNNADSLIEKNLNEINKNSDSLKDNRDKVNKKTRKSNNSDSLPENRDEANEKYNQAIFIFLCSMGLLGIGGLIYWLIKTLKAKKVDSNQ